MNTFKEELSQTDWRDVLLTDNIVELLSSIILLFVKEA